MSSFSKKEHIFEDISNDLQFTSDSSSLPRGEGDLPASMRVVAAAASLHIRSCRRGSHPRYYHKNIWIIKIVYMYRLHIGGK